MGNVSVVGLLTNVFVLPLLPITMLLTFVAGLGVAVASISAATVIALPAKGLLDFVLAVASWGAEIPGGTLDIKMTAGQIVVYYAIVLLVIMVLKYATKHSYYDDNIVD